MGETSFSNRNLGLGWSWRGSHITQLCDLLRTGYKSDFTLILGQQIEKVAVHKIFLQFISPVLNSKVDKCSSAQLEIEDVDPDIFKLLLQYLYTGNSGMTIVQALPLLKMATEYEITPLADQCAALIKTDLSLENVLQLFQVGMEYAHGELIQSTLAFICKNGQKILQLDDFANLRLECLIEIIQQDGLVVLDEIDVFKAVYRWGEAEQSRAPQSIDIRNVLTKALTHVRFPLMDATEFAVNVATKNVLDLSEVTALLTWFHIPPELGLLSQGRFSSCPRAYIHLDGPLVLSRAPSASLVLTNIAASGGEQLLIRCDAKIALKGFTIPASLFTLLVVDSCHNLHYHTELLRVDFSVTSGSNGTIQRCPPLGVLTDQGYYLVKIEPSIKLSRTQSTLLTVRITGRFGYGYYGPRGGYNKKDLNFDTYGTMIANFGKFVESRKCGEIGLVIQRKDGNASRQFFIDP